MAGRVLFAALILSLTLAFARAGAPPHPSAKPLPTVDIQPLGPVDAHRADAVRRGMEATYAVCVRVLPQKSLPDSAWYAPRKRYRAERLLESLLTVRRADSFKTVGLTERDISTTKGTVADWGIFGLGLLGGEVCVVSTFRLGASKVPREQFEARLVKVANHELAHTFGLAHCPTPACLMEDAAGTIRTVDAESGALCASCRLRLGKLLR